MGAAMKYLFVLASFNIICFHLTEGDYYTDESYEDGKTFYDYADKWYGDEFFNGEKKQPKVKPQVEEESVTSNTTEQTDIEKRTDELTDIEKRTDELTDIEKRTDEQTDIEKRLQSEADENVGKVSLFHKLVSSILGLQVKLSTKKEFDPNEKETVGGKWSACFRGLFDAFGLNIFSNNNKTNEGVKENNTQHHMNNNQSEGIWAP